MFRKWRRLLPIVLILVAGVVAARFACRPRPVEVEVAAAGPGLVEDIITNSEAGTIESSARAQLGVERAGRVAAIRFEEGARVRRGDVLVQLDATTARAQLVGARREAEALDATLRASHSNARLARENWERVERLHREAVVSNAERDECRARLDAATAELEGGAARLAAARASIDVAENEIAHLAVRAPFDGVVARHRVELGESVVPGQPVMDLLGTRRLFASAPIDERDAGSLREGLPARVTLDANPGVVWPGRVTRVAPMVEELKQQNRTIEVEISLDSIAGRPQVRVGMTADVEIVTGRTDSALRVPSAAVLDGRRVLVAVAGRARAREVQLGRRNWEWSEVRAGLAAGERVITSLDRPGVREGAAVRAAARRP